MTLTLTYEELEQRAKALERALETSQKDNKPKKMSDHYLESFINSANVPIYLKDAHYKYLFINTTFGKLAQVTHEQVVGKEDFDVFPEPVASLFRSQDEEVIKRRTVVEFEETILLPEGEHTFLTAKFPLIDSEGKIYAVGGTCTDISSRKTAESELKEAEEKYRSIFEHSPLGILHIDSQGIVTACNEKLAEILGLPIEKIIGYKLLERTPKEEVRSAIISVLSGEIAHRDGRFQFGETGLNKHLRGVFSPIVSNDDKVTAAIGIIEDITKQKEAKEALKKAHNQLEQRVAERTAELAERTDRLVETNSALNILLEKREEDKKEIEENIMFTLDKLIHPYLAKLKMSHNKATQEALIGIIQANLETITSSFSHKYKNYLASLTPTQLQIADLIKQGQTTKEIAWLLNLSPSTIACHRQEIRKRLALTNKKANLQTALTAHS